MITKQFNLTPNQFELLRGAVQSHGFNITGTSGDLTGLPYGIKGEFSFESGAGLLTLTITSKPFWMSDTTIWHQIVPAILAVGGTLHGN
jgi:hypothetical protein